METISYQDVLTVMTCGECSIPFAMPQAKYDRCKRDGEGWCCPNGHRRVFCESDISKLQKQLAIEKESKEYFAKRTDQLYGEKQHVEHQLRAQKGQVTRIKNRVSKGVCPCCNRTFADLARHMESKHPDFTQDSAEGAVKASTRK